MPLQAFFVRLNSVQSRSQISLCNPQNALSRAKQHYLEALAGIELVMEHLLGFQGQSPPRSRFNTVGGLTFLLKPDQTVNQSNNLNPALAGLR